MKKILFFAFIVLFLSSCATLPSVSSTALSKTKTDEYTYYDASSKVHYEISNDADYLHIKLNTADFASINKIVKTGLTIYFDVEGKKDDAISLEYPLANKQKLSSRDKPSLGSTQNRGFELDKMLSQKSKEAVFTHYETREPFLIDFNNSGIEVALSTTKNKEIVYEVRIPFEKIKDEGLASLENLSIGIVSGKMNMPNTGGAKPSGISNGGRQGGGGKRGGGMHSGGNRPAGMDMSSMMTPIKIWVKVNLHQGS